MSIVIPTLRALLLLGLAACGPGPKGTWAAAGAPVPPSWAIYVSAAEEQAPCSLHASWGGRITFHASPFDWGLNDRSEEWCRSNPGTCYWGLSWPREIHTDALEGSAGGDPVLSRTALAYELANELGMACWPVSYRESAWTSDLAARITARAESLITSP